MHHLNPMLKQGEGKVIIMRTCAKDGNEDVGFITRGAISGEREKKVDKVYIKEVEVAIGKFIGEDRAQLPERKIMLHVSYSATRLNHFLTGLPFYQSNQGD